MNTTLSSTQPASHRPLRILLSEGSSTSAREAVTALGIQGHRVEICDPDPRCISRFSRFVRRYHRCPGLGSDPAGYVAFTLDLVARERFDVLLPIHEQGYALSTVREQLEKHVAVALPSFETYERGLSKARFSRLLSELKLPQPRTQIFDRPEPVRAIADFPFVIKSAIGTASRGVWMVTNAAERDAAVTELERTGAFRDGVLAQQFIDAPVEHAQTVFDQGRLVAMHAYRQVARGAGGGDARKESISRPRVREHLAAVGGALGWHGALSVDYLRGPDSQPWYIDCNPRLVEPMSAWLAGNDLLAPLIAVSLKQNPPGSPGSPDGVKTHLALQALLGCAARTQSRREIAGECWNLATGGGVYAGSREELTPLRWDWPSMIPLWFAAGWLALRPAAAHDMHRKGWGSHLLNDRSVRRIQEGLIL